MATSQPAHLSIPSDRYSCYVLITCGQPSANGEMRAELTFEGDEVLAAYLIENARQLFESATGNQNEAMD